MALEKAPILLEEDRPHLVQLAGPSLGAEGVTARATHEEPLVSHATTWFSGFMTLTDDRGVVFDEQGSFGVI